MEGMEEDMTSRSSQSHMGARAVSIMEILKRKTDRDHPMTQAMLRDELNKPPYDMHATLKTVHNDLVHLINEVNPPVVLYREQPEKFIIRYDELKNSTQEELDELQNGPRYITGIYYHHELSEEDADLLMFCVAEKRNITEDQRIRLRKAITTLGSDYYNYATYKLRAIEEFTPVDEDVVLQNIRALSIAMNLARQVRFVMNRYNSKNELEPIREHTVNPYYIVKYGAIYYLLATYGKGEKVYHFRLDLLSDIQLTEDNQESMRSIPGLSHTSPKEYLDQHVGMDSDGAMDVHLKVRSDNYTQIHNEFRDFQFVRKLDETYDEIVVRSSKRHMVNFIMENSYMYLDDTKTKFEVEVLRPVSICEEISKRCEAVLDRYRQEK